MVALVAHRETLTKLTKCSIFTDSEIFYEEEGRPFKDLIWK